MTDIEWEPGPWYSLPRSAKVRLWLRYVPIFKAKMLWSWVAWLPVWYFRYRKYARTEFAHDTEDEHYIYPCPHTWWELTVAQDPHELGRHYTMRSRP